MDYDKGWEIVRRVFVEGGNLSRCLPNFEVREGQIEMAKKVYYAFAKEGVALLEAGTGTGKTMAYLVPAVYFSLALKKPVVISTKTINLQEQILKKDIPLLQEALQESFLAVAVKGWSNYLCKRRLASLDPHTEFHDVEELLAFDDIVKWAKNTLEGDRSEITFQLNPKVWSYVCADFYFCTGRKCPWFSDCFLFNNRQKIKEANILVVNHALFFTHIASKRKGMGKPILPEFTRAVLDEAHHVEEIASNYLGDEASSSEFFNLINFLYRPHKGGLDSGILVRLRNYKFSTPVQKRIRNMLDSYALPEIHELLQWGKYFFKTIAHAFSEEKSHIRLKPDTLQKVGVKEELLNDFSKFVIKYIKHLIDLKEECAVEGEDISAEIAGVAARLTDFVYNLKRIWHAEDDSMIYSLEYSKGSQRVNVSFRSYPLSVSDILREELFIPMDTVILTSATLTVNRSFGYIRERLGINRLEDTEVLYSMIPSPFNYEEQVVLAIPTDIPDAKSSDFLDHVVYYITESIKIMEGRTFILFTSYHMLRDCGKRLKKNFKKTKYHILIQGTSSREYLLKEFKKRDFAVLLGTDSFWEGVDVPGEDLEQVIIMKLPFKVPTHPMHRARAEFLVKQGKSPFMDYYLPQAVIGFKQGFGRLIRNRQDKGVIMVLDKRIIEKNYGRSFLESIPCCKILKGNFRGILEYIYRWKEKFSRRE